MAFAGTLPSGFLLCSGGEISRENYSELFNVIGTYYGVGNGSTTFNLPNLLNKIVQGGNNANVGQTIGAGLPNINGTLIGIQYFAAPQQTYGSFHQNNYIQTTNGSSINQGFYYADFTFDASYSNSIYGNSDTVQPPAVIMYYGIKY